MTPRSFLQALCATTAALILSEVPASACTVQGARSNWRAVTVPFTLPDGVSLEWRYSYGKAFDECLNEVWLRLRNESKARVSLDTGKCTIDGQPGTAPLLQANAGKSNAALVGVVKTPTVASVSCTGSGQARRPNATDQARAELFDMVLNPSPQFDGNSCQSYSMGLAAAMSPHSPLKITTARQLRALERQLRQGVLESAEARHNKDSRQTKEPLRTDWRAAMESTSKGVLTVRWREFSNLDAAMRFAGQMTGVTTLDSLGSELAANLVQTPVMLSFKRITDSKYRSSHIATVLGVQLPQQTMGNAAKPTLLVVNSAVKHAGGYRNVCAEEALSDADKYRATTARTNDYDLHDHDGVYIVTYVDKK